MSPRDILLLDGADLSYWGEVPSKKMVFFFVEKSIAMANCAIYYYNFD